MTPAERWVNEVEKTTQPDKVVWVDGSQAENDRLVGEMLASGTLQRLNEKEAPGSTLHRSHSSDVARTEHLTFICERQAGRRGADQQLDGAGRRAREGRAAVRRRDEGPHDVRDPVRHGAARLAVQQGRRRDHRQPLRRRQHAHHDPHGQGGAGAARQQRANSCPACTRSATSRPTAASSSTFPTSGSSGPSARATAATRSSARSASRCASHPRWRGSRAGWPSTC